MSVREQVLFSASDKTMKNINIKQMKANPMYVKKLMSNSVIVKGK